MLVGYELHFPKAKTAVHYGNWSEKSQNQNKENGKKI